MFVLVMLFKLLLVAIVVDINHLTDGQEIEEKLVISKRKLISEHDHRTDNVYAEILSKLFAVIILLTTFQFTHYFSFQQQYHNSCVFFFNCIYNYSER